MMEDPQTENVDNVSAVFELLQNARRRGVLYTVRRNGRTSVSELARRIAAWQSAGGDAPDATAVETSLLHSHLPKLDAANVVDYDRDRRTVALAETASDLDPYLRCAGRREPGLVRAADAPEPGSVPEP